MGLSSYFMQRHGLTYGFGGFHNLRNGCLGRLELSQPTRIMMSIVVTMLLGGVGPKGGGVGEP